MAVITAVLFRETKNKSNSMQGQGMYPPLQGGGAQPQQGGYNPYGASPYGSNQYSSAPGSNPAASAYAAPPVAYGGGAASLPPGCAYSLFESPFSHERDDDFSFHSTPLCSSFSRT